MTPKTGISLKYKTDEALFFLNIEAHYSSDHDHIYIEDLEVEVESFRVCDVNGDFIPGECYPDAAMQRYFAGQFLERWQDDESPFHMIVAAKFQERCEIA